jgi:hypothetical protein
MSPERVSRLVLSVSFAIWVVYGTLAGFGLWPVAVGVGLAAGLLLIAVASRYVAVKLMDWILLAYFSLAAVATFAIPSAGFKTYSSLIVWVLYAAGAWGSILIGQPFTLQYARESAPPERWQTAGFLRANRIITTVWGLAFTANLGFVALGLDPVFSSLWIAVAMPLLSLFAASTFSKRYLRRVRSRG